MKKRFASLFAAAILVAAVSSGRRADAQVAFGGTFAGPHGVVSFQSGVPYAAPVYGNSGYRTWRPYRSAYARYSYPRFSRFPRRYRLRRVFVAFPFPHYVTRR